MWYNADVLRTGVYLRHCLNGDQDKFDLVWPSVFSLAVIKRKKNKSGIDGQVEKVNELEKNKKA